MKSRIANWKKLFTRLSLVLSLLFVYQNCSGGFSGRMGVDGFVEQSSTSPTPFVTTLSRFELMFAAQDILNGPVDISSISMLAADPKVSGFESAATPAFDQSQIEQRLKFAEDMAFKAVRSKLVVACEPTRVAAPGWDGCIRDTVVDFAKRAYRRPVTAGEEAKLKSIFEASVNDVNIELASLSSGVQGSVDIVDSSLNIAGWAIDPAWSDRPVEIQIYNAPIGVGVKIATAFTNTPRPDVTDYFAGQGYNYPGDHGYVTKLPSNLANGASQTVFVYAVGSAVNPLGSKSFTVGVQGSTTYPTPPQLSTSSTEGLKSAFTYILMSPSFQLRSLYSPSATDPDLYLQLDLANRLSLFLGSSVADAQTLSLALSGQLTDPSIYQAEVRRLLTKYSGRFAYNVFGQWFGFRDYSMNPSLTSIERDMITESILVFKEIVDQNLPIAALIKPGFTFVNSSLATHYGLNPSMGSTFVKSPQTLRGGVFQQGSILSLSAANGMTKPIVRGKWVNWNLLCRTIPSPSPDLLQQIADAKKNADPNWSVSERLAHHRNTGAACMSCHKYMDPIGLALESYGPLGQWRTTYPDGKPVITSGEIDGQTFSDVRALEDLVIQRDDFKKCIAAKLLTHALGRPLAVSDELLAAQIANSKSKISDIIQAIATSSTFLNPGREP